MGRRGEEAEEPRRPPRTRRGKREEAGTRGAAPAAETLGGGRGGLGIGKSFQFFSSRVHSRTCLDILSKQN